MISKHKKGFVLLMVVALIPLIGMISVIMLANSRDLKMRTRFEELDLRARLAYESGMQWAKQHQNQIVLLPPDQAITLSVNEAENVTCIIAVVERNSKGTLLQITGQAQDHRYLRDCKKNLLITALEP